MRLNDRQLATVLAALRLFQHAQDALVVKEMDHFTDVDPLSNDEIDALCEELNCGGWRSVSVPGGRKHVRDMHEMLVEEKRLLREWADSLERSGATAMDASSLRFRANEINNLIEEGLPKKFRKQEGK